MVPCSECIYAYVLKSEQEGNADGLSLLPVCDLPENVPIPKDVVGVLNHMNDTTATVVDIRKLTRQDTTLSSVLNPIDHVTYLRYVIGSQLISEQA